MVMSVDRGHQSSEVTSGTPNLGTLSNHASDWDVAKYRRLTSDRTEGSLVNGTFINKCNRPVSTVDRTSGISTGL